jgi:hypothetical protein
VEEGALRHEARGAEVGRPHDAAGPEPETRGPVVGVAHEERRQREVLSAEPHRVAGRQQEPVGERRLHHKSWQGAALQRLVQRHGRVERDLAQEWIGAVHRPHLRQRPVLGRHGQRAEVHDLRHAVGHALHPLALLGAGEAVGHLGLGVASQEPRALAVEARGDGAPDGADGGDGRHAEGEAQEEHAKAAQAAAQLAEREAKRDQREEPAGTIPPGAPVQAPVAEGDHARAAGGQGGRVRDQHQRRPRPLLEPEQEVHDGRAVGLVEVARRLVREKDARPRHDRASERHALLLAPRHLRGVVARPRPPTPPRRARPARGRRRPALRRAQEELRRSRARSSSG